MVLFFWNGRTPWPLPRYNSSWYLLPLSKGHLISKPFRAEGNYPSTKLQTLSSLQMKNKLYRRRMKANTYKKQNRTVNYPAICKKKFQLGLSVKSRCSFHLLPWTFVADFFMYSRLSCYLSSVFTPTHGDPAVLQYSITICIIFSWMKWRLICLSKSFC